MTDRTLGATDYGRVCDLLSLQADERLMPRERAQLVPAWFVPALIATAAAQDKLRSWSRVHGAPVADEQINLVALLRTLVAHGDVEGTGLIGQVVSRLPSPVRAYCLTRILFVSVGFDLSGWCGPALPTAATRPWLIVVCVAPPRDVAALEWLVAHEIAHAWLMPEPKAGATLPPALLWSAVAAAPLWQAPSHLRDALTTGRRLMQRDETEADALVAAWGFGARPSARASDIRPGRRSRARRRRGGPV